MPSVLVGGFTGGRKNFGIFLNCKMMGKGFQGVEVGTHRGEFTKQLLETWHGDMLYCIDPYITKYDEEDPISRQENRQADILVMVDNLRGFKKRHEVLKMFSVPAALSFDDESLAFVYIDGNHQSKSVEADIGAWYPKVMKGGIIAGHDFICTGEHNGGWGQYIQPIVMQFAERINKSIHVVAEQSIDPWSWYIEK